MKCKKSIIRILCAVMALAISVVTIWDFSRQLRRALTRETYTTLSEVSQDYNKAFLDSISYNIKTMKVLAGSLGGMQNATKENVIRELQNTVDNGGFTKIAVCDTIGRSFTNEGSSSNISYRDYFKKAMAGEINVSQPLVSSVSGDENIIIAVPIYNDNSIIGAILGVYPLSTAGAQLLNLKYYSEGYGFIVSSDGKIIISGEHADKLADEENILSFFEKTDFIDFTLDDVKKAMKNGESACFAFMYNGARRFVSFTPSKVNDWYTFSISSDALMLQQEKITNRIVFRLVLKLTIVGVILLLWIAISNRRYNKEIRDANQKYQSLLDNINGGLLVAEHAKTPDKIIATYVSHGFTDMTGYTLEDIQNLYQGRYLDLIPEEDRKISFENHMEQLSKGNTYRIPYRIRKKDGSIIWVMDNGYLVKDGSGMRNHSVIADITTIKQQEEELRLSEKRFSIAINASSGALFEIDMKNQLYTHFENALKIFGVDAEKLLADTKSFSSLPYNEFIDATTNYFFHQDDYTIAKNAMIEVTINGNASYEARLRRFDNSYIWSKVDLSLSVDESGKPLRLVGFISDINEVKKRAELLESKVQTDPMTGLYNKIAMDTLANKILLEYPKGRHALIVLDIDNFKGINDTLGHAFGDLILIDASTKLKTAFRKNDIVGRMGGDEFAILMKNVSDTGGVLKKATELSGAFRQTYSGEREDYRISCSIGIIMIEGNDDKFDALYRKADAALYQAKKNGKDQFVLYQEKDADTYPIESSVTNDEELQNLRAHHNTEEYIFELLYATRDFSVSINRALAVIGQQYHVSRAYIFENDENGCVTRNVYEWCNEGISSEINNLQEMNIVLEDGSIFDGYGKEGLFYCNDVRELPMPIQRILEPQGIRSTLQMTIESEDKVYGFIGFDECKEYRVWKPEEIEKLSFLSKVLSVFLFKRKTEEALLENLNTRLKILDILPDYICVVNPETHSLVYTNNKMQELLPDAQSGAFCFTTLRGGQAEPCETCLVERIKRGDTENLEIVSEDRQLHLAVNAISINWTENQKMVLLYGIEKNK